MEHFKNYRKTFLDSNGSVIATTGIPFFTGIPVYGPNENWTSGTKSYWSNTCPFRVFLEPMPATSIIHSNFYSHFREKLGADVKNNSEFIFIEEY